MHSVFVNANVRDIRLGELSILVQLGETGLDDAPLLVLETLRSRHCIGSSLGAHSRRERGVGTISVTIGRPVHRRRS